MANKHNTSAVCYSDSDVFQSV